MALKMRLVGEDFPSLSRWPCWSIFCNSKSSSSQNKSKITALIANGKWQKVITFLHYFSALEQQSPFDSSSFFPSSFCMWTLKEAQHECHWKKRVNSPRKGDCQQNMNEFWWFLFFYATVALTAEMSVCSSNQLFYVHCRPI